MGRESCVDEAWAGVNGIEESEELHAAESEVELERDSAGFGRLAEFTQWT